MAIDIYKKLKIGFPESERKNLFAVCKIIALAQGVRPKPVNGGVYNTPHTKKWLLLCDEYVHLPLRVYFSECSEAMLSHLTDRQRAIYHCIFSASSDGFARERHLKALFACDMPDFALPYLVQSGGDYVMEILQTLYTMLCGENLERYRKFCSRNMKAVQSCHSRMMSYWHEYYRDICPVYSDYVGKELFEKCFGFYKTGQKEIRIYNIE